MNCPSQYTKHDKPDDYLRTLQKEEAKKSRSSKSASGSQSNKRANVKRSDVPQLGQQAKQSIPALKVPSIPPLLQQQDVEEAKKWAIEWDIPLEDILGSQDDKIPKAVVAPKPIFVRGESLVPKEKLAELPTHMRNLNKWYLTAAQTGRIMIVLNVPEDYYGREETIHVDFSELFQMYNADALDKSLMSCYCV